MSRDVRVKIGKHSWNIYPLEAFGFLLGDAESDEVLVALPCSKTHRWDEFDDRWCGLKEHRSQASEIAGQFQLEVVGVYGSTEGFTSPDYRHPGLLTPPRWALFSSIRISAANTIQELIYIVTDSG